MATSMIPPGSVAKLSPCIPAIDSLACYIETFLVFITNPLGLGYQPTFQPFIALTGMDRNEYFQCMPNGENVIQLKSTN